MNPGHINQVSKNPFFHRLPLEIPERTPEELFEAGRHEPLVVAFILYLREASEEYAARAAHASAGIPVPDGEPPGNPAHFIGASVALLEKAHDLAALVHPEAYRHQAGA